MSAKPASVAVLISAGRHPISGTARACRGDAVAMGLGLELAGSSLRVIHAGCEDEPALKDYLALGASHIDVVSVPDGADAMPLLAAHVRDADIILTGQRAERGQGSGLLPYLLAHALARPIIADVLRVEIASGEARIRQFLPKGKRRSIAAPFPLVLAVHPMAPAGLHYAHARSVACQISVVDDASAKPQANPLSPVWTIEQENRRPVRLKAGEIEDAHERMLSYIQTASKGGTVAFDGSPVDKAQILLTYLREHHLVDF